MLNAVIGTNGGTESQISNQGAIRVKRKVKVECPKTSPLNCMRLLTKNLSLVTLVKDATVPRASCMGRAANLWGLFCIQAIASLTCYKEWGNHVWLLPSLGTP